MGSTGYLFEQAGGKNGLSHDAKSVPEDVVQVVKGVEVAVLDALRPENIGPMSTSEALAAAEQIDPETIFTHLTTITTTMWIRPSFGRRAVGMGWTKSFSNKKQPRCRGH